VSDKLQYVVATGSYRPTQGRDKLKFVGQSRAIIQFQAVEAEV